MIKIASFEDRSIEGCKMEMFKCLGLKLSRLFPRNGRRTLLYKKIYARVHT